MKTPLLAASLFALTAVTVVIYPEYSFNTPAVANTPSPTQQPNPQATPTIPKATPNAHAKIEVVFVLDTTGSMGGLIQAAKEKIWSIATTMASAQPAPEIRMGLVAFRDRGDSYVTRRVDLSTDLDSVYAQLMDFRAEGGGDGPESVNQALDEAVNQTAWSSDPNTYKVVFLVGDAPPHMDYQDDVKYPATLAIAQQKGIAINAIQCGDEGGTKAEWQRIAQLGNGSYFAVAQSGSAVAVASPFDRKLADLSAKLDATRLFYGSTVEKAEKQAKLDAADKLHAGASIESRARRATFNASPSGAANLLGEKELIDDVSQGKVDLSKLDRDKLPAAIQALAPAKQKAVIEEKAKERLVLQEQIGQLAKQRADYLKKEVGASGRGKDSLDSKIFGAIKGQAEKKGLRYEAEAPAY